MERHPTPEMLKSFLLGRLTSNEERQIVAHLLSGCLDCKRAMAPVTSIMFRTEKQAPLTPREESEYELAISSAAATVLARQSLLERERAEAGPKISRLLRPYLTESKKELPEDENFWTWGLCEALQEMSWKLRQNDPAMMLHLATLAVEAAQRLRPARYGGRHVADQLAEAWAGLANAYRVSDRISSAEAALAQAFEARHKGTGSPFLRARLAELSASLLCDQRQFPAAFRLLDLACSLYLKNFSQHEAGRALVAKALHTGYTGDPEQGIRLLASALQLVDRDRDPKLVFQILHNILLFRVELGQFRLARIQLWEMRPMYSHHGDHIAMVKLRGIEGRIYVGLKDFDRAERAFLQVKEGFEQARMIYDAALISFDLASVWLQKGKRKEVRQLIQEMLDTFRARYIAREAIASLLMLRDAADRGILSLDLLDMVAGFFRSLKDEPKAQDPGEMH